MANTGLYVDHRACAEACLCAVVKSDWLYRLWSNRGFSAPLIAKHQLFYSQRAAWQSYIFSAWPKSRNQSHVRAAHRVCQAKSSQSPSLGKHILLVYLEDVQLPPGISLRLNRSQAIFKCNYSNNDDFMDKLVGADGIDLFRKEKHHF